MKALMSLFSIRSTAALALAGASLLACAGSFSSNRPSIPPGTPAWSMTFGDSPCVLRGADDLVTSGDCGEQRKLVVTPAVAKALGAKVQALQPETEAAADGRAPSLLTAGAVTTRIEPAQADALLRDLEGYLNAAAIDAREARFKQLPASASCPAGQIVLTINSCPGDPSNPLADVCLPPTHTCGVPQPAGAMCQRNAGCASNRCSAVGVCE